LIRLYVLDLAMHKLAYELGHAPERIRMPCRLIADLVEAA
jgi:hypothetical protein